MNYTRKPCDASGYKLWQISNLWQRMINDTMAQHNITHVQYLLLATIVWMNNNKMTVNQKSLASQSQSHKMMTSKVLRSLEKNGLVTRSTNTLDTRYKDIHITEKGFDKYVEVQKEFKKVDSRFFEKIERNRFSLNKIFGDIIEENQGYVRLGNV
jgi:DNA-binding MarR family transcriptional regulator